MRHKRKNKRFGIRTPHRQAMLRNMVTSLIEHGRIKTTLVRAKELRRLADKMVSLAKDGSLHSRRQALSVIRDKKVVDKLFTHWAEVFKTRNGGYTRVVRIGYRRGDATMMVIIEMVEESLERPGGKAKKSSGGTAAEKPSTTVIPHATEQDIAEEKTQKTDTAETSSDEEKAEAEEVSEETDVESSETADSSDKDDEAVTDNPEK